MSADSTPHSELAEALALIRRMCWGGPVEVSQATDAWRTLEAHLASTEEQLRSAETTLAHAEAFIEHQDMSYRWAEWCEGRNPTQQVPDRILGVDLNPANEQQVPDRILGVDLTGSYPAISPRQQCRSDQVDGPTSPRGRTTVTTASDPIARIALQLRGRTDG